MLDSLRRHIMMLQGVKQPVAIMGDGIAQISLGMSIATLGSSTNHYIYKTLSSTPIYPGISVAKKGLYGGYTNTKGGCIWVRDADDRIIIILSFKQTTSGSTSLSNWVGKKAEGHIIKTGNGQYLAYYKLIESESYSSSGLFNYDFQSGLTNVRIWANGLYLYEFEVGNMLLKPWIENGEVGLMDVNTMTFHGNDAGAGSFTAIYE